MTTLPSSVNASAPRPAVDPVLLQPGLAVRHVATGRVGRVHHVHLDNSCSDPACCGGPFDDSAWVIFTCGHADEFTSGAHRRWDGFAILPDDAVPPVARSADLPTLDLTPVASQDTSAAFAPRLETPDPTGPILVVGAILREIETGQLATITALTPWQTPRPGHLASLHFACGCEDTCTLGADQRLPSDTGFTVVA